MQRRPPKRLRFRKIYRAPIIRITIDVSPMVRALQQLAQAVARCMAPVATALQKWQPRLSEQQCLELRQRLEMLR